MRSTARSQTTLRMIITWRRQRFSRSVVKYLRFLEMIHPPHFIGIWRAVLQMNMLPGLEEAVRLYTPVISIVMNPLIN